MTRKPRRQFLRRATMLAIGMALGKLDTLKASGGLLTVPLDQWQQVVFIRKGKRIAVSVDDIFEALSSD